MSQLPIKLAGDQAGEGLPPSTRPAVPAPDAVALFRAFRRRWPLALGGGLLAAALVAAGAWVTVPPAKYRADGAIRVSQVPPRIMPRATPQQTDYLTFQKTQTALITGRGVLKEVINDPEVARLPTIREVTAQQNDPTDWLAKQVSADFAKGSEILTVSMNGDLPKDIAVIVNKIIEQYMKRVDVDGSGERKNRIEKLRALWDRYQQDLKQKRTTMRQLAVEAGSDDKATLAIKSQLAHDLLNQTESERLKTKYQLNRLQAEIAILEGSAGGEGGKPGAADRRVEVSKHVLDDYLDNDPHAAMLAERVDKSLKTFNTFSRRARLASEPAVVRAREQLADASKALADYREKLRATLARRLANGPRLDPGAELAQLKRNADILKKVDEGIADDVKRRRGEIEKLNVSTLDLQTEQDEIAKLADIAHEVGREVESMEVESDAPERIQIEYRAEPPRARDELKKLKVSGGAAAGAFACVLLGVTFWESRSRRVNTTDEVVKGLGIRLVGALPAPRGPSRRRLTGGDRPYGRHWQSVLVESVDATRTMLLHAAREDSLRVVMVTSASAGEGKTTLSCHLTASLARAGLKTLLIDCDLRRPAAHRLFDQPAGPGVSELLRGETDLDSVIRQTQAPDLDLIPAGVADAASVRAVAQGGLQAVFDELRSRYDFIIVDSAPVLPVVDSLIISQHTDAVLFSILRDVSRIPAVQDARDRLSTLGVRILGAVVSGVSGQAYNARYGDIDMTADPKAAPAAQARA